MKTNHSWRRAGFTATIAAAAALMLSGCFDSDDDEESAGPPPTIGISTLSSAPDQVSGGDVLLQIDVAAAEHAELSLWLNDADIGDGGLASDGDSIVGLLGGLVEGENLLEVHHSAHGKLAEITLVNHPITGPIFSGPQQYPFVCSVVQQLGVQPLVDAADPPGYPVLDETDSVIGYSRDCSVEPIVTYWYRTTGEQWAEWPEGATAAPEDAASTTTLDGATVPFVVRQERGTINRFIYSYAALVPIEAIGAEAVDTSLWNGRLLYHFQGGVAIGHAQGSASQSRTMRADQLALGYAIAYSTGTRTNVHYNLQVGGETALMVKEHFIKRYGVPLYTVGLGASGGAIQQYVYAQNHPGLLDAGVPVQSYPDMVTQTIHIGDCELLEYYMDATDRDNPRWQVTENRSLLVGLNATDAVPDPFAPLKPMFGFSSAPGSSECVPAWRGLTPLALNPLYGQAPNQQLMVPPEIMGEVHWTHYDDLRNIYGVDEDGWARVAMDNVGVQYGLNSVANGEITPDEFLKLNALVGSWKDPRDMVQEAVFPFFTTNPAAITGPDDFDPWSSRNMRLSADPEAETAPRMTGDLAAIEGIYRAGMVYDGQLDIPVIDWRPYLEHVLDMHNVHQSFAVRQRIRDRMGHSDNQSVWFTDARPTPQVDHVNLALEVIDEWMANIRANPGLTVAENRPDAAADRCFDTEGNLIAAGDDVWDGILDDEAPGACTAAFPLYTTSRIEAGGPITGSVFKCQLQSVADAIAAGVYGTWAPTPEQVDQLNLIFPDGVCDYSLPDAGRPADL